MINGHDIDKIEFIIIGAAWSCYGNDNKGYDYQIEFMRDLYYACNTFYSNYNRPRLSLEEEKTINMTAMCKVVDLLPKHVH